MVGENKGFVNHTTRKQNIPDFIFTNYVIQWNLFVDKCVITDKAFPNSSDVKNIII